MKGKMFAWFLGRSQEGEFLCRVALPGKSARFDFSPLGRIELTRTKFGRIRARCTREGAEVAVFEEGDVAVRSESGHFRLVPWLFRGIASILLATVLVTQAQSKTTRRPNVDPEREIRKMFLAGDLEGALARVQSFKRRKGDHGERSRSLFQELHFALCRRSIDRKDWKSARRFCEEAQQLGHAGVEESMSTLSLRARRLYFEGYTMERSNPEAAKSRYQDVLLSAPTGSPYREKARKKIKLFQ